MTAMRAALAFVAAVVVACVVLVTLSGSTGPVAQLESKGARPAPVKTDLKETKDETLARTSSSSRPARRNPLNATNDDFSK
ncbi:hypothetical protein T484DRAFT_1864661 [Baffinella frigidus]|nr:hypothetical protein T484DRAFT_1864661 [Cryptophyta sp. CCMP2293]